MSQADKFHMYVTYCRNKPDSSLLIQQHGVGFFEVMLKKTSEKNNKKSLFFLIWFHKQPQRSYYVACIGLNWSVSSFCVGFFSSGSKKDTVTFSFYHLSCVMCVYRKSRGDTVWLTPSPQRSSNQFNGSPNTSCCSRQHIILSLSHRD